MSLQERIPDSYRSGFVALIGRPNVGKSTLINRFVGEKIAITSPVAQTTRNRLKAILTRENAQLILVDTPGIHKPHHLLGERLVKSAKTTIGEVDVVLLILESCFSPGKGDNFIVKLLRQQEIPVIVALNKWDLINKDGYEEIEKEYRNLLDQSCWPIFKCSAITGEGCDDLINALTSNLPIGPQLYPTDIVSDQPERLILAELIREQVLIHTREEIPHSVAVIVDRIQEMNKGRESFSKQNRTAILATIMVERKSQKGILIGKGGSMLKMIGKGARLQMQTLIEGSVYLELFVKVVPDWRSKPARLAELGYKEL